MKEQSCTEEIENILKEAPAARKALLENYNNLRNVAEYCENNYLQAGGDSIKALEETKAFTTQSLASVAYQISTLATNVLKLLDAQCSQLRHIESDVNLIGLTVDMHREKVARREIGAFTVAKRYSRSSKIIPLAGGNDPKPKYSRTPITYSNLDTLGHGMKDSKPQERKATINRKHGGTLSRNRPAECPVAPTLSRGASETSLGDKTISSFGKAVPPPVAPSWPVTPETDIICTLLEDTTPPPPPPMSGEDGAGPEMSVTPPPAPPPDMCDFLPPPPPPGNPMEKSQEPEPAPPLETVPEETGLSPSEADGLHLPAPPPPPPTHSLENGEDLEIPAPPPSPPPPMDCIGGFQEVPPLPPPVDYDTLAPMQYLEKVVALYTYEASKPGDLSFQEGDVIYLTRRNDNGWCEGILNGVEGFFPGNYVETTS